MSLDGVKPAPGVQAVHPNQDSNGQSSRESQRDGKPKQPEPEKQDQPDLFLNSLGQLIGKTINITA